MTAWRGSLTYSPRWAAHVVGRYDPREVDPETGEAEPQEVRLECSRCGATHKAVCTTGAVRGWVNRFALGHVHGDALDPARVVEMGRRDE